MPIDPEQAELWYDLRTIVRALDTGFVKPAKFFCHLRRAIEVYGRRGATPEKVLDVYPRYVVLVDPQLRKHRIYQELRRHADILWRFQRLRREAEPDGRERGTGTDAEENQC